MTCLEKYLQEHPDHCAANIIRQFCPNMGGGIPIEDMKDCDIDQTIEICERCWNRQIPGIEAEITTVTQDDVLPNGNMWPTIKDSGSRQEFSTGAVRDIQKGKGRCDLMPLDVIAKHMPSQILELISTFQKKGEESHLWKAMELFQYEAFPMGVVNTKQRMANTLLEVAKHFEEGAEKYGENNWQKGLPVKSYINSAVRHYLKWLRGDEDEPHDRAFCWNILCAIWTCKHKPELNEYGLKTCPVCDTVIPEGEDACPHCRVHQKFDPDDFMGEYEEEND